MQSLSVIVTFTKEIYDKVSSFLTDSKKKKKSKTNTNKQKQQRSKQTNKKPPPLLFLGVVGGDGGYIYVFIEASAKLRELRQSAS